MCALLSTYAKKIKSGVLVKTSLFNTLSRLFIVMLAVICTAIPAGCVDYSPENASTISIGSLPREAIDTLQLIKNGGPFPFRQDGATFHNFEGLLPEKPDGYYREYTVITPGSSDRGARRIVSGKNGEYYYTEDHYASFKLILE
jgi:ribonuclease T1